MIFDEKKTEAMRREEYMRRYQLSKQRELEEGREGELYKKSLENIKKKKRKKRIIRNIKQVLVYICVLAVVVLIILGLYLAIKQLFTKKDKDKPSEVVENLVPIEITTPVLPTSTPIPEKTIELPNTAPVATIPPIGDYRGLVVIDAGHGGMDGGTTREDVIEKDINLSISKKLKKSLEDYGYTVSMTRDDDTYVKRMDRVNHANNLNCAAFISIHCNAYEGETDVNGIEVWCYDRKGSVELSNSVLEQVVESTGGINKGVKTATNLTVTRHTTMPACLVECGYLTGSKDFELLQNDEYQQRIADGIIVGLDLFLRDY